MKMDKEKEIEKIQAVRCMLNDALCALGEIKWDCRENKVLHEILEGSDELIYTAICRLREAKLALA